MSKTMTDTGKRMNMTKLDEIVNELSNLTLLEAGTLAKMLREKWGIAEVVPPMMRPADSVVTEIEQAVEKEFFDVVLKDIGPKKIEVIKSIRKLTQLGLSEA